MKVGLSNNKPGVTEIEAAQVVHTARMIFSNFEPFQAVTSNRELWPDLLSSSGPKSASIGLIANVSVVALCEYARSDTRESADFGDLVERAKENWDAFQTLTWLCAHDLRRPGVPNQILRQWMAKYLEERQGKAPRRRNGVRIHLKIRGILLSTLIDHANRMGYRPYRNKGQKAGQDASGCNLVRLALLDAGWRNVPTVPGLEKIWGDSHHHVARSANDDPHQILDHGFHPESLLSLMARMPAENLK